MIKRIKFHQLNGGYNLLYLGYSKRNLLYLNSEVLVVCTSISGPTTFSSKDAALVCCATTGERGQGIWVG